VTAHQASERNSVTRGEVRLLVVDDDPLGASLAQAWFGRRTAAHYTVEAATTLRSALQRLGQGGVDVVLLDLGLPDSQGLDTLRSLLAAAPTVPVLVLSGWQSGVTASEALQLGARGYFVKGDVALSGIEKAIRQVLGLVAR